MMMSSRDSLRNPCVATKSIPRSPPLDDRKVQRISSKSHEESDGCVGMADGENTLEKRRSQSPSEVSEHSESMYTTTEDDEEDNAVEKKDDFVEFRELRVFERLEKMVERPSFCSQASAVDRFMNHNLSFEEQSQSEAFRSENRVASLDDDEESTCSAGGSSEGDGHDKEGGLNVTLENDKEELDPIIRDRPLSIDEELEAYMRDMYKVDDQVDQLKESDPELLCAAVMMRLQEQEHVMENMKHELHLTKELRKALETKEAELEKERLCFETFRETEKLKIEKQEKRVSMQRKSIEKVSDETVKLRQQNSEHLAKINTLTKKIARVETDLRRKYNLWESDRKKLMERIELLEKLNKELEDGEKLRSVVSTQGKDTDVAKSSLQGRPQKRIQFIEGTSKMSVRGESRAGDVNGAAQSKGSEPSKLSVANSSKLNCSAPQKSSLKKSLPAVISEKVDTSTRAEDLEDRQSNTSAATSWYNTEYINEVIAPKGGITRNNPEQVHESSSQNYKTYTTTNNLGDTETVYSNGSRKYISKQRNFYRIIYQNGDIKEKRPDGSVHYFFSELGIRQYHYPNGLEMTSYPNGQTERKNPDGTHEVLFTNGCVKFYRQDGREDYIFPDNTVYQLDPNGDAVLFLPNGQKEIHSANWKKRIYPDGTTKTLYNDGTFETEYPNGRIRRRDPSGKLVSDNENQSISTAKTTNGIGGTANFLDNETPSPKSLTSHGL